MSGFLAQKVCFAIHCRVNYCLHLLIFDVLILNQWVTEMEGARAMQTLIIFVDEPELDNGMNTASFVLTWVFHSLEVCYLVSLVYGALTVVKLLKFFVSDEIMSRFVYL